MYNLVSNIVTFENRFYYPVTIVVYKCRSAMPSLPKRLSPIQVAIAEMLSTAQHHDKLYCSDDLATIPNLAADNGHSAFTNCIHSCFTQKCLTRILLQSEANVN